MPHKTAKNPHRIVRVWITPGINSNNGVAVGHSGVGHNNHGNNQDVGLGDSNQEVDRNDGGSLEEVRNNGGNLGHHNSVVEVQRMLRRLRQMPVDLLTVFSYPSPFQKLKRWLILKGFSCGVLIRVIHFSVLLSYCKRRQSSRAAIKLLHLLHFVIL